MIHTCDGHMDCVGLVESLHKGHNNINALVICTLSLHVCMYVEAQHIVLELVNVTLSQDVITCINYFYLHV